MILSIVWFFLNAGQFFLVGFRVSVKEKEKKQELVCLPEKSHEQLCKVWRHRRQTLI